MKELCEYPVRETVRCYDIEAIEIPIVYNPCGDHDPDGLVFVTLEDADRVRGGKYEPEPLILRANAGEWIEVTLHNLFDKPVPYFDYPSVPLDCKHKPSMRVSLNPQFLSYDPVCGASRV